MPNLKFLSYTFNALSDGILWVDQFGAICDFNASVCALIGYEKEDLLAISIFDIQSDLSTQEWEMQWERHFTIGKFIKETELTQQGGRAITVEITYRYYQIEQTPFCCLIIRNIAERKKMETQFLLSYFTVEQAGDAIFWISRDGQIMHTNEEACKRLGYSYRELIAMNIMDVNRSYNADRLAETFDTLKNTGVLVIESEHYTKEGKAIPVEIAANYIEYEGVAYTCSIVRDITERKHKEAALRGALFEIRALKERLEEENNYLQEEIQYSHNFGEIISRSTTFHQTLRQVEQVASTHSTVLITGESGTGKELIARSIHQLSKRSNRPMIKVNCAALPTNLIESELFGHEKGAFTGALSRKKGRFELASGGTLFLDEIGEMPMELQAKLLRVLQEGEFERLGGGETINVDVRIISATNRNLLKEIEDGNFREDLYYRLNVFPLHCPPLRERKEDIPLLVQHFCKKFESKTGRRITNIPQKVLKRLAQYDFPGNIRELENIIERAVILSSRGKLEIGAWLPKSKKKTTIDEDFLPLATIQKNYIIEVLKATNWRISGPHGAARILDMRPTTLESRMKKLGIKRSNEAV